jgi:hypothetical protein
VRIDEAGHDRAAAGIEGCARRKLGTQLAALTGRRDPAASDGDRGVRDDAQLSHRRAAARRWRASQGRQLADVVDEEVGVHGANLSLIEAIERIGATQ